MNVKKGYKGFIKGESPWNKGKQGLNCGRKKGCIPWNKGKPNPELSKRQKENNISKRSEVKIKMRKARLGVRPWNWNGGHSKNRKYVQDKWKQLIKEIYKRDNWICFDCNKQSGRLNVHHLKPWCKYPELAFDKNNLITLCVSCHAKRHNKEGRFCETQEVMNENNNLVR